MPSDLTREEYLALEESGVVKRPKAPGIETTLERAVELGLVTRIDVTVEGTLRVEMVNGDGDVFEAGTGTVTSYRRTVAGVLVQALGEVPKQEDMFSEEEREPGRRLVALGGQMSTG